MSNISNGREEAMRSAREDARYAGVPLTRKQEERYADLRTGNEYPTTGDQQLVVIAMELMSVSPDLIAKFTAAFPTCFPRS